LTAPTIDRVEAPKIHNYHIEIALARGLIGCELCGRVATSREDLISRTCEPMLLVMHAGRWNKRHIKRLRAFLGALTEEQRRAPLPLCCDGLLLNNPDMEL
jgi:hypothetical protein